MRRRRRRNRRLVKLLFVLACVSCFLCGFRFGGARTIALAGQPEAKEAKEVRQAEAKDTKEVRQTEAVRQTSSIQGQSTRKPRKERKKYYTCITIETGDSLYKIAETYMSDEYESIDQYISEIKQINGMICNDLEQGEYLTIPYYNYV